MKKLKVGIYGANGHQIWSFLEGYERVEFIAAAEVPLANLEKYTAYKNQTLKIYSTLDEMLEKSGIDLVCLCSPVRAEQVNDAIKALNAGVNVYAEKPAALTESDLNAILEAEKASKAEFHEIADTVFFEPYSTMRELIKDGAIGEVVQVYAQKSYPNNFSARPNDYKIDGGITRQVGVHAARFIEHICGVKITEVKSFETKKGAPCDKPELAMATSVAMKLDNGGIASACINYFNPKTFGLWGNESVRAFGTKGVIEITDGGRRTHLWNEDGDKGEFAVPGKQIKHYFVYLVEHLLDGAPMPIDSETELHPLRAVIRIAEAAE
jgi:predicted dehydrogenase